MKRIALRIADPVLETVPGTYQPPVCPLQAEMRDYQLESLRWSTSMYDNGVSCILADEMGLGKTLQAIAFIANLLLDRGTKGPALVVAPLSVLSSWMQVRVCLKSPLCRDSIKTSCNHFITFDPLSLLTGVVQVVPGPPCRQAPHMQPWRGPAPQAAGVHGPRQLSRSCNHLRDDSLKGHGPPDQERRLASSGP